MSQFVITNGSTNTMDPTQAKEMSPMEGQSVNSKDNLEPQGQHQHQQQQHQPNIRHIPIFVEGRDEPLFNKNAASTVDAPITTARPPTIINDIPQSGSIFNRAKDIPVKKIIPEFHASNNIGRGTSPARTIPINVIHTNKGPNDGNQYGGSNQKSSQQQQHGNQKQQQQQQNQQKQQQSPPQQQHPQEQQEHHQPQQQQQQLHADQQQQERRSQSPKPPPQPVDPIIKIQNLQKEILQLMDRVEKYKGGSGKDKEYIYLDEMLTQNLLKLDTIDTEGKDNIKAARKEAINCINKCIQVLEAKAGGGGGNETTQNESSPPPPPTSSSSNPSKDNNGTLVSNPAQAAAGQENHNSNAQESST